VNRFFFLQLLLLAACAVHAILPAGAARDALLLGLVFAYLPIPGGAQAVTTAIFLALSVTRAPALPAYAVSAAYPSTNLMTHVSMPEARNPLVVGACVAGVVGGVGYVGLKAISVCLKIWENQVTNANNNPLPNPNKGPEEDSQWVPPVTGPQSSDCACSNPAPEGAALPLVVEMSRDGVYWEAGPALIVGQTVPIPDIGFWRLRETTMALVPQKPTFYESWAQHGPDFTEAALVETLNSISNLHLASTHHPFVVIVDGGWAASARDARGRLQFDPAKFPSGPAIVDLIHNYGCLAAPWVEQNGPVTTLTTGTPSTSGTNVEFDARTIAEWGFDGAKFDLIDGGDDGARLATVTRFVSAFREVARGRSTYFYHDVGHLTDPATLARFPAGTTICENSENDPGHIVTWTRRMVSRLAYANSATRWICGREVYEGWPEPYGESFVNLWSLLGSPYVFTAVRGADTHWPFYHSIYAHPECVALNNDPLYAAPVRLWASDRNIAIKRQLANGTVAAVTFNTSTATQMVCLTFSELGLPAGPAVVRDVFAQTDLGTVSNELLVTLPPMGSRLLVFDSVARPPVLRAKSYGAEIYGRRGRQMVCEVNSGRGWTAVARHVMDAEPWVVPVARTGEESLLLRSRYEP
jgi:hypothetical protein